VATSPANSILGTIDLFQKQTQRNRANELADRQFELATQREARLGRLDEKRIADYDKQSEYRDTQEQRDIAKNDREAEAHILDIETAYLGQDQTRSVTAGQNITNKTKSLELRAKTTQLDAEQSINFLAGNNFIDLGKGSIAGESVLTPPFWKSVVSGDKNTIGFLKQNLNDALELTDETAVKSIEVIPQENGQTLYAVNTINGGVITEDGTSIDDSKPVLLTAKQLDGFMNTHLRGTVIPQSGYDVIGATTARGLGTLLEVEQEQDESKALAAQVNQVTGQALAAMKGNPAGKRALSAAITEAHETGGDQAVLEFMTSLTEETQMNPAEPDAPTGPLIPGQEATPYESNASSQFLRDADTTENEIRSSVDKGRVVRMFSKGFIRNSFQNFGDSRLQDISKLMKEIDKEASYFSDTDKTANTTARTTKDWYASNSDALAQRFQNDGDAIHAEITSLGAQGFYEKYKDVDIGDFSPVILDLNGQISKATNNTQAGTRAAIQDGTFPAVTEDQISAVRTRMAQLQLSDQSTMADVERQVPQSDLPGLLAVMVGQAESTTDQLAIYERMANLIQTGNMQTNPDDITKTAISGGTLALGQRKFANTLEDRYQAQADEVITLTNKLNTGLLNTDGTYKSEIEGSTQADMQTLVSLVTDKNVSQGKRNAATDALLPNIINYLGVKAKDNSSWVSGLAFWRDEGAFAVGDIRSRVRVTNNQLILLDGGGNPVTDGTFTKRELAQYLGADLRNALNLLQVDPE
jgi:hypothetical protein